MFQVQTFKWVQYIVWYSKVYWQLRTTVEYYLQFKALSLYQMSWWCTDVCADTWHTFQNMECRKRCRNDMFICSHVSKVTKTLYCSIRHAGCRTLTNVTKQKASGLSHRPLTQTACCKSGRAEFTGMIIRVNGDNKCDKREVGKDRWETQEAVWTQMTITSQSHVTQATGPGQSLLHFLGKSFF